MKAIDSKLNGILPNKKLNRWEVWYNGRLLMSHKERVNCIWYVKYCKLSKLH
jgi:hypothetical protein